MYYGATSKSQILETIRIVCNQFPNPVDAYKLIAETIACETLMGTYRNSVQYNYGLGLSQFDKSGFLHVKNNTKKIHKEKILNLWNIDIDKVEYRELAYSPLLSVIFCRLYYLLIPSKIPETLELRAQYWKRYYNSLLGKGTVQGYIDKSKYIYE